MSLRSAKWLDFGPEVDSWLDAKAAMPQDQGTKGPRTTTRQDFISGALTRKCHWKTRDDSKLNKNAIMRRKQRIAETTTDSLNGFRFSYFSQKRSCNKGMLIDLLVSYLFCKALILDFRFFVQFI